MSKNNNNAKATQSQTERANSMAPSEHVGSLPSAVEAAKTNPDPTVTAQAPAPQNLEDLPIQPDEGNYVSGQNAQAGTPQSTPKENTSEVFNYRAAEDSEQDKKETNSSLEVSEYHNEGHPASAHAHIKTTNNTQEDELRRTEETMAKHATDLNGSTKQVRGNSPQVQNEISPKQVDESREVASRAGREISDRDSDINYGRAAKKQKEVLDGQKKQGFHIPLSPGEKKGALQYCNINGLEMWIPKGRYVQVPEDVRLLLSESLRIDVEAGEEFRLDQNPDKDEALR